MTIAFSSFKFDGFAYNPGSVTFGDAESKEILRAVGDSFRNIKIRRESVNINLEGLTSVEALSYIRAASGANGGLRTIEIAGKTLTNCLLVNAVPKPQYMVGQWELLDLELSYESQDWTKAFGYESFYGFPVKPEDVKFGESDGKDVQRAVGSKFEKLHIYRRTCTITLRGIPAGAIGQFRLNSKVNFVIGGIPMPNAVLLSIQPGAIVRADGYETRDTVELKYETSDYVQNVQFELFKGWPITEEDVSFSYETKTISINGAVPSNVPNSGGGGVKKDVVLRKPKVTITLKGTQPEVASEYLGELDRSPTDPATTSVTVAGRTIANAVLTNVNPSGVITIDGISVRPTLQLEYTAATWSDGSGSSSARFKGYEIEGVSFGDAETEQVEVNNSGARTRFNYKRYSISINLSGIPTSAVASFFQEAANNRRSQRTGNALGESISLLGISIGNCLLISVNPSGKTNSVGGTDYVDGVSLTYESRNWD